MNTWYYSDTLQTYGPVAVQQLTAMIQSGQLTAAHFVMPEGGLEWQTVAASPFSGYLPAAPAAPAAVPAAFAPAPALQSKPQAPAKSAGPARPAGPPKPVMRPAGQPEPKKPSPQSTPASSGTPIWIPVVAGIVVLAGVGWWLTRPVPVLERTTTTRIEGEAMKVMKVTGGDVEPQPMKQTNALWSGDAHLWWHGGSAGYSLDLEFTVEPDQGGKQRLKAAFTSSYDYGIVELSLDGKKLKGKIFDLQANGAVISGARDLGVQDLTTGPHVLRIGILDTSVINMDKREAYKVGLDYLQLEPPVLEETPAAPGTNIASKAQPSAGVCIGRHVRILSNTESTEGRKSGDDKERFTWIPSKGNAEWAQYEWNSPQAINECRIFWFDGTHLRGQVALPAFWRLLYREEATGAWLPVDAEIPAAKLDTLMSVKFTPVLTSALRIAVQCQENVSAGIVQWQVIAADPTTVPDPKTREHPDLFLGDLSPLHAQMGSEAYRVNLRTASAIKDKLVVMGNGMPCSQFLWAHADSRLDFGIPEGYTRFTAYGVGYADPRTGKPVGWTDWNYTVMVDGRIVEKSSVLTTYKDKQFAVDVTIPSGAKVLSLLSGKNGNGYSDHAHWAYPTLLTADSQKRPNTPTVTDRWPKLTAAVPASSHAPAPPKFTSLPKPLYRFTFDGDKAEHGVELTNVPQHDGIIEINGVHDDFRVSLATPEMNTRRFTAAVRVNPDDFDLSPMMVVNPGNNSYHDILLSAAFDLQVEVTRNRELFFAIEGVGSGKSATVTELTPGKWMTVAVVCDLDRKLARAYLDGKPMADIQVEPSASVKFDKGRGDRRWNFRYHRAYGTFKGAVDELVVYDEPLTNEQVASLNLGGTNRNPTRKPVPDTDTILKAVPASELRFSSATSSGGTPLTHMKTVKTEDGFWNPVQITLHDTSGKGAFNLPSTEVTLQAEKDLVFTHSDLDVGFDGVKSIRGHLSDIFASNYFLFEFREASMDGTSVKKLFSKGFIGKQAPPFEISTLDKRIARVPEDYRGKLLVLHLWFDDPSQPHAEFETLQNLHTKHHEAGLEILSIHDGSEAAVKTAQARNFPWAQAFAPTNNPIYNHYRTHLHSMIFFINGNTGEVMDMGLYRLPYSWMDDRVSALLGKVKASP